MTVPVGTGAVVALAAFLVNAAIWLPAVAILATAGIPAAVICILRGRRK